MAEAKWVHTCVVLGSTRGTCISVVPPSISFFVAASDVLAIRSHSVRYIYQIKNNSCEIEDLIETHFCKLRVILTSRALRVTNGFNRSPYMRKISIGLYIGYWIFEGPHRIGTNSVFPPISDTYQYWHPVRITHPAAKTVFKARQKTALSFALDFTSFKRQKVASSCFALVLCLAHNRTHSIHNKFLWVLKWRSQAD